MGFHSSFRKRIESENEKQWDVLNTCVASTQSLYLGLLIYNFTEEEPLFQVIKFHFYCGTY